jgi:histone-lysine N-methyltransferase SETMAR
MIMVFFTAKKLIVFDVFPRGGAFNQLYFVNNIFADLKIANLNSRRQKTESTFGVHINNSIGHNGSKATSRIKKNHISRMPHPPYSPDISLCDFYLFGMLKQILRDRKFSSSNEIEDATAQL